MLRQLLIATALFSSVAAFAKTEKVEIDPAASKVVYTGKKTLVDSKHTGEVKIKDGFLNFDGNTLKGGEFVIDMTTITNTDLTDAEYNKKFVGHITSEDFFDTAKFGTSKLVIKNAKKEKDNTYNVTGDLTIKGKTAPVNFTALVTKSEASANITVDRTKHDVKYGSGSFFKDLGDKVIADNIEFVVTLKAKK
ncbi:YceI family protein [Bacteriovorax stolpii]|uniref:YceI family protein n=1 Tax=Bacteriovorax stolpii TaxID=960 RepID=A0A2K9NQY2_BACTC|nr:YceI family protein [Bacteriovorax stolpii]AUN97913.1 YceI family protein [Bacteriovorax stolpii]QDK42101.1 YceI family protein [Bacteriovorax stolpii]TDP51743.1 polyisoprenoid-binding protein YceI [Bacteriovorax stolpii]